MGLWYCIIQDFTLGLNLNERDPGVRGFGWADIILRTDTS